MTGDQLQLNLVTCPHCQETIDVSREQKLKILDYTIEEARKVRCAAWRRVNEFKGIEADARALIKAASEADKKYEALVQKRFKMRSDHEQPELKEVI